MEVINVIPPTKQINRPITYKTRKVESITKNGERKEFSNITECANHYGVAVSTLYLNITTNKVTKQGRLEGLTFKYIQKESPDSSLSK